MCEYTGLTETAIQFLNDVKKGTITHFKIPSEMYAAINAQPYTIDECENLLYVINFLLSKEDEINLFELIKNYLTHEYMPLNADAVVWEEESKEYFDTHIRLKDKKSEQIYAIPVKAIPNIILTEIQNRLGALKTKEEFIAGLKSVRRERNLD